MTWVDSRGGTFTPDIYAQRIDGSGVMLWPTGGVAVCAAVGEQSYVSISIDGLGGAILVWEDQRTGSGGDIYSQHVDSSGSALWATNGIAVCADPNGQASSAVASDGEGGVFVAWADGRNEIDPDVYVQRVNGSGAAYWTANGVALCTAWQNQERPRVTPDGTGGAIIVWDDYRHDSFNDNSDIYGQRVSAVGATLWQVDGVPLAAGIATQKHAGVASDGVGGAIVSWQDDRSNYMDIYAQRIDPSGTPQWAANGVAVCTAQGSQGSPQIISDGVGGAVVIWQDEKCGLDCDDLYAARISGSGLLPWTANGVVVSATTNAQRWPAMIADGWGGIIVAWQDTRNGTLNGDIYGQRVTPSGSIPTVVHPSRNTPGLMLGRNIPNPFSAETLIELQLADRSPLEIEVYDVLGRTVRTVHLGLVGAGPHQVEFDGRDNEGRPLASGVYFYRVIANGTSATRKMVLTR